MQADVLTTEAVTQAKVSFAAAKPKLKEPIKRVQKQEVKTQELESKLTLKYGKALKML